jgi:hypothetical protein
MSRVTIRMSGRPVLTIRPPTFRLLAGLGDHASRGRRLLRIYHSSAPQPARIADPHHRPQPHRFLLLLRVQNGLNALALTMRDMVDSDEPYPLTAWQPQFLRIRGDLEDALSREEKFSLADRSPGQRRYLTDSFRQFWDALDRIFDLPQRPKRGSARQHSNVFAGAASGSEHRGLALADRQQRKRTDGRGADTGTLRRRRSAMSTSFSPPC